MLRLKLTALQTLYLIVFKSPQRKKLQYHDDKNFSI